MLIIQQCNNIFIPCSVLFCDKSEIFFLGEKASFSDNRGKEGGAIVAYGTILHFGKYSTTFFSNNSADNGGAICLNDDSFIIIDNATLISLWGNNATYYGGGIFVQDRNLWLTKASQKTCFVQSRKNDMGDLYFAYNKAGLAGHALYGGWIDVCIREGLNYTASSVFHFYDSKNVTEISSNPSRICILCIDSVPNRYQDSKNVSLFPGQSFIINIIAVGQRFGVVPTTVRAEVKNKEIEFGIIDD